MRLIGSRATDSHLKNLPLKKLGLLLVLSASVVLGGCNRANRDAAGPPQFAELMPVAMAAPMAPSAPPPAPVAAPAPMMTGPMFGGHLASYSKEADAVRGWDQIVRRQSSIGTLKRYVVPINTARGPMVRLIAGDFTTNEEANRFCTWAKQQSLYCAVMQLDADRKSASPVPAQMTPPMRPARTVRQPSSGAMPAPMAAPPAAPMAPPAAAPMTPPVATPGAPPPG